MNFADFIITPEQAYAIINSSNRLVLDHFSEKKVFFNEFKKGDEGLFYYDDVNDESILLAPKSKLDKCTWFLDHGYIEAVCGNVRVWNGDVYIKPEHESDGLV